MSIKALFSIFLAVSAAAPSPLRALPWSPPLAASSDPPFLVHRRGSNYSTSDSNPCGPVAQYYNAGPNEWIAANTDQWLENWIKDNQQSISNHSAGFAGAFGQYAVGDPDFTCQSDGSVNCNVNVCANPVINSLGNSTEPAYYVLQALQNLHAYYIGMSQSFEASALLGALETDEWVATFYCQKNGKSADATDSNGIVAIKEALVALVTVVGVGLSFVAGPEVEVGVGIAIGVGMSLFSGASSATNAALQATQAPTDNFDTAAAVGQAIANVVQTSLTSLINNNNNLMMGKTVDPNNATLGTLLQKGTFINSTVDEVGAISTMGAMIQGMAINQLYRLNKIFILGGGNCGDGQGIGSGPGANYSWCDTQNKAWYIYFWQADDVISLTSHQWGWTAPPPGIAQLGNGTYANITVQDVIRSSVGSYAAGGYNYTSSMLQQRTSAAIANGAESPQAMGSAWEGVFTIPVCNISQTVGKNYQGGQYILQPYGQNYRPMWCGPICDNDLNTTKAFINAANMNNFKSPKHSCSKAPGY